VAVCAAAAGLTDPCVTVSGGAPVGLAEGDALGLADAEALALADGDGGSSHTSASCPLITSGWSE